MGRGRGKGKKQSVIANLHEDPGNVDEETLPISRRRGRPKKPLNYGTEEEEEGKEEEEEEEEGEDEEEEVTEKTEANGEKDKNKTGSIDLSTEAVSENGRKRKSSLVSGMKIELTEGVNVKSSADDSTNSAGFRKIGSRRKAKPHRAAQAGVNMMMFFCNYV